MLVFDSILLGWALGNIIYYVRHNERSDHSFSVNPTITFTGHESKPNAQYKSIILNTYGSDRLNKWIEEQENNQCNDNP